MLKIVVGHSLSEIAATYTISTLSLELALSSVRFTDAIYALTQQQSLTSKANSGFLSSISITDLIEVKPTAALRRSITDTLTKQNVRIMGIRLKFAAVKKEKLPKY
ncbi:hypothetical protein QBC46DRAFT_407761 [Diplogelasinospora grovesii]|uniref:Uncharacterized protein n=1 Tax=Diplogelasinospora grovesii TaxID=303347 RepID=A0AAN6N883_9PEZI|nr:hypothetical protein QBC46DRAFT_407761 [Diplogelasinospora grovesii]